MVYCCIHSPHPKTLYRFLLYFPIGHPHQWFSILSVHYNHPDLESLLNTQYWAPPPEFLIQHVQGGAKLCIGDKFLVKTNFSAIRCSPSMLICTDALSSSKVNFSWKTDVQAKKDFKGIGFLGGVVATGWLY